MATFLVTGATGAQGSAVVNYLSASGAKVHAVVREPSSAKATALRDRGVVLFQGTHEAPDTVFREAAKGCSGLFLNPSVYDPEESKRQATAILAACKAGAGGTLTTVVLSSTCRTGEISNDLETAAAVDPGLAVYYAAKGAAEVAVREGGFPHYTILRPAVLNHDLLLPMSAFVFSELPKSGELVTALDVGVGLSYLDENDVGKIAAAALLDPAKFSGHEIDLAAETLPAQELRDILARVSGRNIELRKRTPEEVEEARKTVQFQMFELLENFRPHPVDGKEVERKYGIKLTTLAEYLEARKESLVNFASASISNIQIDMGARLMGADSDSYANDGTTMD